MKDVFYMLAVFPILWELFALVYAKQVHQFATTFIQKMKEGHYPSQREAAFSLYQVGYAIWCIVGLFSSQGLLFLAIFILSMINKKKVLVLRVDAILSLVILQFILINEYHLNINLAQWLTSLVKQ